jgi:RHS repeat-associated protein
LTDSYDYKPYGELLAHNGTSDNDFLFTGEQLDQETDNYYLRARYYSPNFTRFLSRDSYDGTLDSPLSQNHYLYAGGNPVLFVDPSGHMNMMSLSINMELMTTLSNVGFRAVSFLNMINKAESLVGLINMSYSIREVLGKATQIADTPRTGLPNIDYKAALRSATYNIPAAIATGIGNWSLGYQRSRRKGNKVKSFLLYMPLITSGIGGEITMPTPAKISFGRYKVPLKLVFGGPKKASGTLVGIGVNMAGNRQLIRMDYHKYNSGHGGTSGLKADEIAVWRDGDFHYHVRKW